MKPTSLVAPIAVALFVALLSVAPSARAQTETVLHSFTGADGQNPYSGLIADASGNLYGTTVGGGTSTACPNGCGTVYELVNSSGTYTHRVLLNFTGGDGSNPYGNLLMDSSGNLYGTTFGGITTATAGGTVFELVNSSGSYTEKILYIFKGNASGDGCAPAAGVIMDSSGNLYGTTSSCGASDVGTVFELVNSSGTYTEKVLYNFSLNTPGDGYQPSSGLIMDSSGNLFGTTRQGGSFLIGTVYELVNSSGTYTEKAIYSFTSIGDGDLPYGGLIMDSSGNLYGTTSDGGLSEPGPGTVYELVNSSGTYTEKTLYSFTDTGGDGANPQAGLIMDSSGSLYGTTGWGGASQWGTAFEVTPPVASWLVSTSALNFGVQVIDAASLQQSITVINSGSTNLTFAAGAVTLSDSGSNASEFAIALDGCSGQTVAPHGTCSVAVMFTPNVAGAASATLNFANNVGSSPQTVSLSGTVADFSIAVAPGSSSSATVSRGMTASYLLAITPDGGWMGTVNLACSGAPSGATCSVTPSSVVVKGTTASDVTATVTTTAPSAVLPFRPVEPPSARKFWPILVGLLALLMIAGATMASPFPRRQRSMARIRQGLLAAILLGVATFAACGGGGGGGGNNPPPNPGTPKGTYTLTVTGTLESLSHSATLTLTVQ